MKFRKELEELNACEEAMEWVGDRTLAQAWAECPRGDWLLWYAARTKCDRKKILLAACACARTALPYASGPEALAAIEAAEAWCRGETTLKDVREAGKAARDCAASARRAPRGSSTAPRWRGPTWGRAREARREGRDSAGRGR